MSSPLVSICIPTYNGQEFLDECLQSCIDQDFEDYEIVVCDDGSTDSTKSIVEKYSAKNPRVRLIKNEKNLGLVGNWNKCLQEARGEWIKFVFQDDCIAKNCLNTFVAAIDVETKLIVSARNFILPASATGDIKNYYRNEVRTLQNTSNNAGVVYSARLISNIAIENMSMNFIAEPSLSFFKKDVINELGMFNPELKQICDLEFLLKIASRYGLKYIPEKICAFRIHGNTTTSTNLAKNYFTLRYIEPLLLSYFLLFGNGFAALRNNLSLAGRLRLKLYFRVKAFQAYSANNAGNHNHPLFGEDEKRFSEISAVKKGNLFVKLITLGLR